MLTALLVTTPVCGEVAVEDSLGRSVVLPQPARRIVALAPHIVENLYAAGAGKKLVAAVEYSDFPPQASALPKVGGYNTFSLEAILAASPDLVVVWASGNGLEIIEQLNRLGIAVYADEPETLEDIAGSIRKLGALAGTETASEQAADDFLQRLNGLRSKFGGGSELTVFYQIWHQPLQTLSGDHIVSDVLEVCGAKNAFADAVSLAPVINIESVLQRNPDVILASGAGEEQPEWLDHWRRYPGLKAVQTDSLYSIPPDYIQRHTPRILIGTERVCQALVSSR